MIQDFFDMLLVIGFFGFAYTLGWFTYVWWITKDL